MSTDTLYFGIDFGTTNSSMAWYDPQKGEAKILVAVHFPVKVRLDRE